MTEDLRPPFRQQFDNARDPYTARNALGITSSGGGGGGPGGAPVGAEYIVSATDPTLTAERVLTNTASITWDFTVPGQAKANTASGGGNVSNSGTPTLGQYAKWTTATTIQGVSAATVLGDIGAAPLASPTFTGDPKAPTPATADNDTSIATTAYVQAQGYLTSAAAAAAYQPLDADLTAIAALTGVDVIYYRSAANTWSPVTIGANLTFASGTLAASGGGGGTPGGSTTQVQFNDAGAFGGSANMAWNKTTSVLTVAGQVAIPLGSPTSILAGGVVETAAGFKNTGTIASLGPGTAGVVALRPNGIASATGQMTVSASGAVTVNGTIELGAATDTTLSRVSSGVVAIEGQNILTVATGAPIGSEYITSTADATLTSERVLTDTATVTWDRTTAGQIKATAVGGGTATPVPPQGRLTLQTGVPVMTTTQAAKTTIYYTPYVGNQVPLWNGTTMTMTSFTELSVATTDTTKSPAAIGASKVNDWFVWNDAGTIRLGHGPDWTTDILRAPVGNTPIRVNGVWLNDAAITNGPASQRGTYVGTTRSNASSQLDWINGGLAAGGTAAWFGVWNAYNRRSIATMVADSTDSWAYSVATWRAANASLPANMRATFVSGLQEDWLTAQYVCPGLSVTSNSAVAIGFNSTSTPGGAFGMIGTGTVVAAVAISETQPFGVNFVAAMEYGSAAGCTFYGDVGTNYFQNGLHVLFYM